MEMSFRMDRTCSEFESNFLLPQFAMRRLLRDVTKRNSLRIVKVDLFATKHKNCFENQTQKCFLI